MHSRGFSVFPVVRNGKKPAVKNWQSWAQNCSAELIRAYAVYQPNCNWGIDCGASDITVVDIDPQNGGDKTKTRLEIQNKFPGTFTVSTPRGGTHLYYKCANKTSTGGLGEGIDTRGFGGLVVCPGSIRVEGEYEIQLDCEIPNLPTWVISELQNKTKFESPEAEIEIEEGERKNKLLSIAGMLRNTGLTRDSLLGSLIAINENQVNPPISDSDLQDIADSVSKYAPRDARGAVEFIQHDTTQNFVSIRGSEIVERDIPKRDWVLTGRYIGKFISLLVSPGGIGKSTLLLLDAISICTGRALSYGTVTKTGAVWVYNTEDPLDEMKRRIVAVARENGVPLSDLSELHVTSGRDNPLILVQSDGRDTQINEAAISNTIKYINENNIVLFLVDPFVRTHRVSENDNVQIDRVVNCFQQIAEKTGCAIGLAHHSNKTTTNPGDANSVRGASALINAARVAHTVSPMTKQEAIDTGTDQKRKNWYFRLDTAKANLQAPASTAQWFERVSTQLVNGDSVGAIKTVSFSEKTVKKIKQEEFSEINV